MSKRRTRRQKESTDYSFLVSWKPDSQDFPGSSVKGQFKNSPSGKNSEANSHKSANILDKNDAFVSAKRDMAKSLILASLILALELVIYLAWR